MRPSKSGGTGVPPVYGEAAQIGSWNSLSLRAGVGSQPVHAGDSFRILALPPILDLPLPCA